jgi:hypothetical protein
MEDILAFEQDLPRGGRQLALGQEAHDGMGGDRLARAGFAHQAQDLARRDGDAHLLDGVRAIGAPGQRHGEPADLQNRTRRSLDQDLL